MLIIIIIIIIIIMIIIIIVIIVIILMMMMMMCLYCLSDKNTYYLMLGSAHVDEKVGRAFPHSFIASWRTLHNRCANYVDILLTKRILGPYLG